MIFMQIKFHPFRLMCNLILSVMDFEGMIVPILTKKQGKMRNSIDEIVRDLAYNKYTQVGIIKIVMTCLLVNPLPFIVLP